MSIVPDKIQDAINFFETHWGVWDTHVAQIGMTAAQSTNLKAAMQAARTAFNSAQSARDASKAATQNLHGAMTALRGVDGAGTIALRAIKTYAENTNNPDVYSIAQIPPPAQPTPQPAPGQPTAFKIFLNANGSITLKWKSEDSTSSSGAWFAVARKLAGQENFVNIGGSPKREFLDATLPLGADSATYIVTPYRNTLAGEASAQLTVQFGVGSGGQAFAVIGNSNNARLAA